MLTRRIKHALLLGSASLLLLTLASATATATVAKLMTMDRLIDRSDRIGRATVAGQKSQFDKKYNLVTTRTTLEVQKTYWGAPKKTLVIEQFGGEADGMKTIIAGDAKFTRGEDVILFLKDATDKSGLHYLTAMAQAKYTIKKQADGSTVIWRDLDGLTFHDSSGKSPSTLQHVSESPRSMPSFIAELEAQIAGIKGPRGGKK